MAIDDHLLTTDISPSFLYVCQSQEEPKWVPHTRNEETDKNPYRVDYLSNLPASVSVA